MLDLIVCWLKFVYLRKICEMFVRLILIVFRLFIEDEVKLVKINLNVVIDFFLFKILFYCC